MPFSNPRSAATSYLILRHLYDGDIIEWPIADDHPLRSIFEALEAQGLVARWDRIWPLSDRYRLTERGIAAIEAVYRPSGAEAFFAEVRARNLPPAERRAFVASRGLDPVVWPLLHDPHTHWSNVGEFQGQYYGYLWEDQRPPGRRKPTPPQKPKPAPKPKPQKSVQRGGGGVRMPRVGHHHHHHRHGPHHDPTIVDLDDEAADPSYVAPVPGDYDVS